MLDFSDIISKIKQIENIMRDKDFADIIGLKPDALVQRKNRNSIPHDNIIKYCLKNKISIDTMYENINVNNDENIFCGESQSNKISPLSIFPLIDEDNFVKLPIDNRNKKLNAYINYSENTMFIIDKTITQYTEEGLYLTEYQDTKYVKNITNNFNGTYQINSYSTTNKPTTSFEINSEKINEIQILGQITNVISLT